MTHKRTLCMVMALAVGMAVATPGLASPKVGDKAPKVKVAKWMTKAPPALPGEKGAENNIYVVEFWATWCPPCRKSIPHLAEMHKKYGKDNVVILGISNEEASEIEGFLKKTEMPYFVGQDDDMATNEVWMDDIQGIPHAFIVNKDAQVVWTGNPLEAEAMEETIKQLIAGKFDLETAKNAAANAAKYDELMGQLQKAYGARNEEEVFKLLDQMIAMKPAEMRAYLIKRQLLREFDRKKDADEFDFKVEAAFKDDAGGLRDLAEMELQSELSRRNPALMLRCARRANEIQKGRDGETLATLAQVECSIGLIEAAIGHQKEAVALAPKEMEQELKDALNYMNAVKSLIDDEKKTTGDAGDEAKVSQK